MAGCGSRRPCGIHPASPRHANRAAAGRVGARTERVWRPWSFELPRGISTLLRPDDGGGSMGAHHALSATYEAHPNIALVKYWGVREESLVLPYNRSVSVTLDRLCTRTTVMFDPRLTQDRFILNGQVTLGRPRENVSEFLDRIREESGVTERAHVRSTNNFQTASGLASSASGFAALAGAAAFASGLKPTPQRLSQLARLGSGSASRSIFGGFVEWKRGRRPDGRDCFAEPIASATHWPDLVDVVALIRGAPTKTVRSSRAMQLSVANSPLYADRQ